MAFVAMLTLFFSSPTPYSDFVGLGTMTEDRLLGKDVCFPLLGCRSRVIENG